MNEDALDVSLHPNQLAAMVGAALSGAAVVAAGLMVFLLHAVAFEAAHLRSWSLVAFAACLAVLALCGFQWLAWMSASRVLAGRPGARLIAWERPSWWVHVASYPTLLVAVICCAWVAAHTPVDSMVFWLAAVAMIGVVAGQAVGATQYLRFDGPPGTIPAHVRNWVKRGNERADARADESVTAG